MLLVGPLKNLQPVWSRCPLLIAIAMIVAPSWVLYTHLNFSQRQPGQIKLYVADM
jgi:hypothetical protein